MTESKNKLQIDLSLVELIALLLCITAWPLGLIYMSINKVFTRQTRHKLFVIVLSITAGIAFSIVIFRVGRDLFSNLYNFNIAPKLTK